jgi:hypothetical protein
MSTNQTQPREWTGDERRGIDGITLKLMAELRAVMEKHEQGENKTFNDIKIEIKDNRNESERRHSEVLDRFAAMQTSTMALLQANTSTTNEIHKLFKEAFPQGDAQAHRKAHEHWIEKDKTDREFWLKLKQNTVNAIVLAAAGWIGLAVWAAFLKGPN